MVFFSGPTCLEIYDSWLHDHSRMLWYWMMCRRALREETRRWEGNRNKFGHDSSLRTVFSKQALLRPRMTFPLCFNKHEERTETFSLANPYQASTQLAWPRRNTLSKNINALVSVCNKNLCRLLQIIIWFTALVSPFLQIYQWLWMI